MPDPAQMEAAVLAYVTAFERQDAEAAVALFATVEDPVGAKAHRGTEAIRAFYTRSMATGAKLKRERPIRTASGHAAFAFSVNHAWEGKHQRVDVTDIFRFDETGKVVEMRAYFGPNNMNALS